MRRGSRRPSFETCAVTHALRRSGGTLRAACLVSGAINILALTGPLYMLEVYNRVLPSGSTAGLALLTLAMLALHGLSGALDFVRLRLLARTARHMDARLSARVFALLSARPHETHTSGGGLQALRDLDQIRTFLASQGPTAFFDMPWMPLYLGVTFLMHPLLGGFATAGAALLVGLMLLAERQSAAPLRAAVQSAGKRWALAASVRRHAETINAMGFARQLTRHWIGLNARHLACERNASRPVNAFSAAIKVARPALQSGMLGLGAYLVINGESSPGAMIAASIVLSRALAPVEIAIAHWRSFTAARQARTRLAARLAAGAQRPRRAQPPPPCRSLRVAHLTVAPAGVTTPAIRNVSFALTAGSGLGIVGPSASGKSTLARALVGAWPAQRGGVSLDEHAISDWTPDRLGRHVGYLPQDAALLAGTIANNIARFEASASFEAIMAAARAAGIDEMIGRLPRGYDTEIGEEGLKLSAGQRQRIGLARALYRDPFLVVLDEPDANLDAEGVRALNAAVSRVRRRGGIAIVIAHRLSALESIDTVLALRDGRTRAYGPKDAVLQGRHMRDRPVPAALTTAAE